MDITLNYWAILVAVVAINVLGALWYGPLFGKLWMNLSGWSEADRAMMKTPEGKKKGTRAMLLGLIPSIVMVYVLAHIVYAYDAITLALGIQAGFWVWLGFIATVLFNAVLYERKPVKLYLLNIGYYFVALLIAGVILAIWR